MRELSSLQLIITTLLSSSVIGGIIALLTKKVTSPEARADFARLGNEFAHQLLQDAKLEREELRMTIRELEGLITENKAAVDRLTKLLSEKTERIYELELSHRRLAEKFQRGEEITLADLLGPGAPRIHLSEESD